MYFQRAGLHQEEGEETLYFRGLPICHAHTFFKFIPFYCQQQVSMMIVDKSYNSILSTLIG